jgi:hypothetical protein
MPRPPLQSGDIIRNPSNAFLIRASPARLAAKAYQYRPRSRSGRKMPPRHTGCAVAHRYAAGTRPFYFGGVGPNCDSTLSAGLVITR